MEGRKCIDRDGSTLVARSKQRLIFLHQMLALLIGIFASNNPLRTRPSRHHRAYVWPLAPLHIANMTSLCSHFTGVFRLFVPE